MNAAQLDVVVASMEDNLATFLGALLQPVGSCCKQISTPKLEVVVANMEGALQCSWM